MKFKHFLMAAAVFMNVSCAKEATDGPKAPITKPEIQLSSDRFSAEALWAMGRIGSVVINEQDHLYAYTVSYYSVEENRSTTWIRITKLGEDGIQENIDEFVGYAPSWMNDGSLLYLKGGQLHYRGNLMGKHKADYIYEGFDKDIEDYLLSPDNQKIVLIAQVKTIETTVDKYPDLPLASGHIHTDLMYKHWDEWTETAPQPFIADIAPEVLSNFVNILEGTPYESPLKPFGGAEQLAWSPDSKTLAYTCRKKTGLDYALSTNSDIYLYNIDTRAHENITEGMMGYDTNPSYSEDGQYIAWLSMERDGYESDENRLFVMNLQTREKTFVTKGLDTNVDEYYWRKNNHIVFAAVWHACEGLYDTDLEGNRTQLKDGQYDYQVAGDMGEHLIYLRHSMCEANEIYMDSIQLTYENKNIYDQVEMGTVIPRWQKTTDGKQMLTWVVLPPHFDPNKKYPTLLYCEGGPQSPVSQFWSFRWNFMMMAAHDYVVIAPNRRGLPGFGLEWNEEISGDYGGQCMKDYFTAIDEAVENLPYVDKDRLGCVGASFGGFSVYWIAGHHNKRFKAFIAHDGIFNLEMQYLETEEKWFANWDMGGAYWDKSNKTAMRTFENSPHKFVDQWDTPILCIHGEKDYRILANQAMAAFDAAKMRGVDAELLIFPDENHWVLQPQNGVLWQRTFFDWLDRYLK